MLDSVEVSLARLRDGNLYSKRMPVSYISDAVSAIYQLDDEDLLQSAGISRSLAIKLKNLEGELPANVMVASLERIRTYLRRIESEFGGSIDSSAEDQRIAELDIILEEYPPDPIPVWSETWVYVKPGSRAKEIISELSDLLEEVHLLAKTTNQPEAQAALSNLERAQLIALLETTLLMLKGPMIERGLLKKLGNATADAAKKAAQKQTEEGMGEAIRFALPRLWELIKWLAGG